MTYYNIKKIKYLSTNKSNKFVSIFINYVY